jgi:guanine deaminase
MRRAISLALGSVRHGGGPFGALIVCDGAVVAEGVNRVTASNDPTAHAEITAIRDACRKLRRYELRGCEIFASCEPCPMCLGAIYWARLDRLYFACNRADAAAAGFDDSFLYDQIAIPLPERDLRSRQLLRREGLAALGAWIAAEDKVQY